MIEEIKSNVNNEIEVVRELSNYYKRLEFASPSEAKLLLTAIESLKSRIRLLNNSLPEMLAQISLSKPLSDQPSKTNLEKVHIYGEQNEMKITLNSKDKEEFIQQLRVSEQIVKKLKKKQMIEDEKYEEYKAARGYLKISNKFFLSTAQKLIARGYFRPLSVQLKKANIDILFAAYIAMTLFTTLIAFIFSLFVLVFFLIFNVSFSEQVLAYYSGDTLSRVFKLIWIPVAMPLAAFALLYYYPSTEKDTLEKKIDQELPFAVIHMSAISGSGIEPSEIFKIIGLSKEYPYLRKEIRKVVNQINLYGYDLVTALSNVTKTTPSEKLAELFSGLATTITTGGNLQTFFEKRSETLLLNYRLEREKYTGVAETFMDIYISVVIAAPMILLILLIMISVTNIGLGFNRIQMTLGIILIISLVNTLFLAFLHMKQPSY